MTAGALFSNEHTRQLIPFPESVGGITIGVGPYDRAPVVQMGKVINLPPATSEVHQLLGGEQLLVKIGPVLPGKSSHFDSIWPEEFYLVGVDDAAFVAPVSRNQFNAFLKKGEKAFYEALKPAEIKLIESVSAHPVRRQGDIWAIKIGEDWKDPGSAIHFPIRVNERDREPRVVAHDEFLFRSRHSLVGKMVQQASIVFFSESKGLTKKGRPKGVTKSMVAMLGSGVIYAPDHPELDLSDGVYVIARTPRVENFGRGMD